MEWARMKTIHRFFDHAKVSGEELLCIDPHAVRVAPGEMFGIRPWSIHGYHIQTTLLKSNGDFA
jgi:hypothetical protein